MDSFIEFDRFKNNGQLNPGTDENSRVRQMPNGNLFISPVELNDEGVYKCHAANELGEASSTGNLTVLGESLLSGKKNLIGVDTVLLMQLFCECQRRGKIVGGCGTGSWAV